jgi:hypothetical protein
MPDEITFHASPKQFLAWKYLTDAVTTEVGYGGAAHGGKSYLGCEWLTDMCLAYPGTGWLLGRKETPEPQADDAPHALQGSRCP